MALRTMLSNTKPRKHKACGVFIGRLRRSRVPHLLVPRKMRYHALRLPRIELTGL